MNIDDRAFNEYFDDATLNELSDGVKALLEGLESMDYVDKNALKDFAAKLESLFADFNDQLPEENPRQTIINLISSGHLYLAYFWNLSRRAVRSGALNWNTTFNNNREVREMVRSSTLYQKITEVQGKIHQIDDRFTAKTGLGGDL